MSGRDRIVILCGTGDGDLMRSPVQTLNLPRKTLLILSIHVGMDMRRLGALGQVVLHVERVADLVPVFRRRNHHLRPVLDWCFGWFISCKGRRQAETAR